MEKRQEILAPFSSDECPNSGEDSEEDVITDYLGSSHSDCDRVPLINGDLASLNLRGNLITGRDYTKDNTEKTAITMSSHDEQQQQQQHQQQQQQQTLLAALGTNNQTQPNPLVPIISVTPHSPGLAKNYPVLEDNLQQLHEIHDCIQRMRDLTLSSWGYNHRAAHNDVPQRLTSSCPSLCPLTSSEIARSNINNNDTGSDPDLLANCSTNSSPTHFPPSSVGPRVSQNGQGIDRRRSWTDLEDTRCGRRRYSGQNHLQAQNMRQRSISLSSLDSEMDIELHGKSCTRPVGVGSRACRSQASTHSLNEADLVQSEYQKIVTKRFKGSQRLADSSGLMPDLTGSRLPLQKSISTPSIVTPQVNTHLTETVTRTAPSLAARRERNEKGSGSETETEDLHTPNSHEFHEDREGTPNVHDELLTDGTAYDDNHSEKTRRKRGSIFFRKKKDKSGKKTSQQQHLWSTMAGSQGSLLCDVCMKQSTNKPLLHCDNCGVSVHQSQGCKDQLVLECVKSKHHSGKVVVKSASSISTTSSSYNIKRGSTASLTLSTSGSGSQTINEEKDGDGQHRDISSGLDGYDVGDDSYQFTVGDLEGLDPELGLAKEEPDSWSATIGHSIALRLVDNCERKVKRQEHIYEFVLTEKHHCLVLLAMERIFAEGLRRHFRLGQPDLERMFPRLRDLIDIHLRFLQKLRRRQNAHPVVPTIADILVDQFAGENAQRMKSAYGEFCSRHRDAVEAYKYYLRHDPRFARFVRQCQSHPLLKKKGIPECILFVTQRLTKYPLLVEPLIKTGIAQDESEDLRKALVLVKEILADVDACVADKEREDRKLEIYHKIDAKSFATYRGVKFKKSDIMAFNRILKFEGTAYLMQGRGKMTAIVVVVLSDILFFLAERDQKYTFFVPDNKAGIVSLQKLLVREKAGQESRGIYLISSNPAEPEMFELKIQKPKDKHLWIQAIRSAVEACPQESENEMDALTENNNSELRDTRSSSISLLSVEVRQRLIKTKESHVLKIIGELRKKDAEHAMLLEEKINLQMQLLHAANIWSGNESSDNERVEKTDKEIPDYTRLVHNEGTDTTQLRQEVITVIQEATKLASSLSFTAGGATLSRSLSSAGERHSEAYVPPSLCVPRRAETFAGFDHNKEKYPLRESTMHSVISLPKVGEFTKDSPEEKDNQELETNKDQQWAAIRLSHHIYRLVCIISNQMTTIDSLQAQLAACKEGSMGKSNNRPNPNRQLEELRNLQDQLSREKAAFRAQSQQEQKQLEEERAELAKQREQLAAEKNDIAQQRDQLYRRLEALERQGVTLVTGSAPTSTTIHLSHMTQTGTDTVQARKSQPDAKRIPLNVISATSQRKVQSNLPVKQQLPLKLASGSNNNTRSGSTSNNSPDRHSRTGSSPAIVTTGSTYSSPELGNNHAGTSQTHSSNRSLRITRSPPEYSHQQQQQQHQRVEHHQQQQQQQQQQQPLEEEVIFF